MSERTCPHCGIKHDPMDWYVELLHDEQECEVQTLRSKLGRVAELARQGRETSQFTHARAALDEIIKLSELPR